MKVGDLVRIGVDDPAAADGGRMSGNAERFPPQIRALMDATIALSNAVSEAREVSPGGAVDTPWAEGVARQIAEEHGLDEHGTANLLGAARHFAEPIVIEGDALPWPLWPGLEDDSEGP